MNHVQPILPVLALLLAFSPAHAEYRTVLVQVKQDKDKKVFIRFHSDEKKEQKSADSVDEAVRVIAKMEGWGSSVGVFVVYDRGIPRGDLRKLVAAINENIWLDLKYFGREVPKIVGDHFLKGKAGTINMDQGFQSGGTAEVERMLSAAISVDRPVVDEEVIMQGRFIIQFGLVNDGAKTVDPEIGSSLLLVNGKEVKEWSFISGNGPRDQRWKALPSGDRLGFEYVFDKYFERPGVYKVSWQGKGFESPEIVIRVLPLDLRATRKNGPASESKSANPKMAATDALLRTLDEEISTKDLPRTFWSLLEHLTGKMQETGKELSFFVDVRVFSKEVRGVVDGELPPPLFKLQPLPPRMSVRAILQMAVKQFDGDEATFLIRQGRVEITTKKEASLPNLLKQTFAASFDRHPLEFVLEELSEITGVSIVSDGRAKDKMRTPITTRFRNDVSLLVALRMVTESAGLKLVELPGGANPIQGLLVTTPEHALILQR